MREDFGPIRPFNPSGFLPPGQQPPLTNAAPPPGIYKPGQGAVPTGGRRPARKPLPTGQPLYGGYTAEQLRASPSLVANLGGPAAARWKLAGAAGGTTPLGTPAPTPTPRPSTPPPFVSQGPNQGGWGQPLVVPPPGGQYGSGLPGDVPEPYAFNDPFSSFLAAVPLMNLNRDQQIGDAMANAGFSGNRFGSFAAGKAAEIGAQNSLAQNALLLQTLSDYANRSEDRALQATGMGAGVGNMLDEMERQRLQLPFAIGGWEQQRQDQFARQAYEDFERSKLGWLPMLMQAAMSQGSGSPGQIVPITGEPAKPGLSDWFNLFGSLF